MMVWVFKRDPELHNAQGFIDVPDVLADRLIQEGKAAAQYDQNLMREPEQPDDGIEPTRRAARAAAAAAQATTAPKPNAAQDAAQGAELAAANAAALADAEPDAAADEAAPTRRTRKP
jgi:hypothetical protein